MSLGPTDMNERARLNALHNYEILDTAAEVEFDRLTELASVICEVPISLISLIDTDRQWFKSRVGLDVSETPREIAFCNYAIQQTTLFEVPDATRDDRFANNPLVTGAPDIRFYAGEPLIDPDGFAMGTLCVIDRVPRLLTDKQKHSMKLLAQLTIDLIVERRQRAEMEHFGNLFQLSDDMICVAGTDGFFKKVNPSFTKVLGWDAKQLMAMSYFSLVHPDDIEKTQTEIQRLAEGLNTINFVHRFRTSTNEYKTLQWVAAPEKETGNLFAIARDITKEKEHEAALKDSEERLRIFFENSQGFMCTHDLSGRFMTVNAAGASSLGYNTDEIVGASLFDIVPYARHTALEAYLEKIAVKGHAKGQMVVKHKKGGIRIWIYNNILEANHVGEQYVIGNAIDVTERYQLEEDLRKTKETLERTSTVARIGGWEIDMATMSVYWSPITRQIHEVPDDYVPDVSKGIEFYKEGESREKIGAVVAQAMADGTPWDLELQLVTFAGRELWVRAKGEVEFENGVCKRVFGTFQDIDAAKKAEEEILRSRKLLGDVLDAASEVSIIATDVEGTITVFNTGAEKLLGYSAGELVGLHSPAVFHLMSEVEARGKELTTEYGQPIEGFRVFVHVPELEGSEQREWTYIRKDGGTRTVSLVATAIRDIDNDIIGYLGIANDVTETRKMQQQLITERMRLAAFVEHAPAAVAMLDTNMTYVAVSKKWIEDYQLQHVQVIGSSHYDVFPNADDERRARHQRILSGAIERKEEDTYIPPGSSEPHYVTWEMRPWYQFDNTVGGMMIYTQDITNIIVQREELKAAKELAEQASIAKSEFLANMSHEIRTPLNGVIGFTDLMQKTTLNETQNQYVNIINQSATALLGIINDILDFSKIEAGKLELDVDKFDLYEMCGQATDIVTYNVQKKKLEMLLNISTELPRYIFADSVRLKQILVNLLSNASKFTERGEIELKIEPMKKDGDFTTIRFGVRDTGIGIKKEKQKKIFEAFSQADGSTTKKYGGTGLGLTISNRLLGLMGSNLQLESTLGMGSYFYFDVTFRAEDGDPIVWEDIDNVKTVLVVDDNANNRTIVNQMLLLKNIKTTEARNGLEALQILDEGQKFDVILMDYHMPYMDGIETIRKIRANFPGDGAGQPIVLLYSSADDDKIMTACDELQIFQRLVKPVKMQEIYHALARINKVEVETPVAIHEIAALQSPTFTVLVVEDNEVNMLLTQTIIARNFPGANILEAINGREAVAVCKQQLPDLILMDIQMPEMNGYEATQLIRAMKSEKHVPIVALTAGNVKGEREKCLNAGMDDFVVKPIVESAVMGIFKRWVDVKGADIDTADPTKLRAEIVHFDLVQTLETVGGDKGVIADLFALVKTQVPLMAHALFPLLQTGDYGALGKLGHKLVGTARTCGFVQLAKLATELELLPLSDAPMKAPALVTEIQAEIDVVLQLVNDPNLLNG